MKSIHHQNKVQRHERGAVSLFVVIFTALLITTITVSFMQLMMKDQQQAMYSDLSESAYDSATAGVEDAKRALLMRQDCENGTSTGGSPSCADIESAIDSGECTTLSAVFGGNTSGEVAVAQSEGDRRLEQAYTCVKVTRNTRDYLGSIDAGTTATLVPLRGTEPFSKVTISWTLQKGDAVISLPPSGTSTLPVVSDATWPKSYPALLRVQLINGKDSFHLSDLDAGGYSNTLFLYPSREGAKTAEFALDGRRSGSGAPQPVSCDANPASGAYACKVTIEVNPTIAARSQTAFLNIAAFYNPTDYKVELRKGDSDSDIVPFDNVQPEVDSTGRANDLFRRVVSRVELNNTFNYPVAALETRHSICKNFSITTNPSDYSPSAQCKPTD